MQDDFYRYMTAAGYTDLQRGERGSTEEHLTVTQFKVEQEQRRLAEIEQQTSKAQEKLDTVAPVVQDAAAFARNNVSYFDELVPEAGQLERAKSYREDKILPLMRTLKQKFLGLYRVVIDLQGKLGNLRDKLERMTRERDHYKDLYRTEQEKSEALLEESRDLRWVRRALGPERIDAVIAAERERDAAQDTEQQLLDRQRKLVRQRHERNAR